MISSPSLRSVPIVKSAESVSPRAGSRLCARAAVHEPGPASTSAPASSAETRRRHGRRLASAIDGRGQDVMEKRRRSGAPTRRPTLASYDATETFLLCNPMPAADPHPLSHFDAGGQAHMVDVAAKAETHRVARASGVIRMQATTLALIESAGAAKGDVLGVARIAAIQGAKRTAELVPLCHPVAITRVAVEFEIARATSQVRCTA